MMGVLQPMCCLFSTAVCCLFVSAAFFQLFSAQRLKLFASTASCIRATHSLYVEQQCVYVLS